MRKHVSDGFSTKAFTYNYLPWNPTNCWFPDFGGLWWFLGGLAIEFHQVLPVVPPAEFPSCHGKPCWFHAEVGWGIYQRPSIWLVFVPPHAFYLWSYLSKTIQSQVYIIWFLINTPDLQMRSGLYPRMHQKHRQERGKNNDSSKTVPQSVLEEHLSSVFLGCLYAGLRHVESSLSGSKCQKNTLGISPPQCGDPPMMVSPAVNLG